MNLLLDTHALIWYLAGDPGLGEKALYEIENPSNANFISVAAFWEIAIKISPRRPAHIDLDIFNLPDTFSFL